MTVVPELRAALLQAAREHASAVTAGDAGRTPEPEAGHGRRRRRRWRGIGGGLAALLVTAGLATASGLVVPERTFQASARLTAVPAPSVLSPGKFSRLGSELVAVAREVQAELPYPPGLQDTYDWSRYAGAATLGTGGEVRREVQIMSEFRAGCLWRRYLVQRHDAGDAAGVASAIRILRESPRWPGTRSMPSGSASASVNVDAARRAGAGDYDPIRRELLANCAARSLAASAEELREADARWLEWTRRNADAIAAGRAHAGRRPSES